jgi:hypothetical protein
MASRAGSPATYKIQFDSNAKEVGEEGASALDKLRRQIGAAEASVKGYESALKRMQQGSVVNIDVARQLKEKIQQEKDAIAQASVQITKAGTSYEKLTEAHKKLRAEAEKNSASKLAKQNDALGKALEGVGGPVADLKNKIGSLGDLMTSAGGAEGLLAIGAVAAVAAIAALGVAIGVATFKLASFIVTAGDMLRNQQLMRTAFDGSEEDAERLGNQVEELARKIKTPREEINKMASELTLAGLGGQELVDVLNAMGQAGAALGPEAANKIKELGLRGKITGRAGLGATELRDANLGFQFKDVAGAIAKNLNVPLEEAGQALVENRVKAKDFDKALADVTKSKFGGVNTKNMFSLDVIFLKAKEAWESLTKSINLEPLLAAFKDLASVVDQSNEAGASLKLLLEGFGGGLVDSVTTTEPVMKQFIEGMILAALDLEIAYLDLRLQLDDTFGPSTLSNIDAMDTALKAGKFTVIAIAAVFAAIATNIALAGAAAYEFGYQLAKWVDQLKSAFELVGKIAASLASAPGEALFGPGKSTAASLAGAGAAALAGHASGGVVEGIDTRGLATVRAAPGEGLASVGKGEAIVPAGGGGGGGGVNVEAGAVVVHYSGKASGSELEGMVTQVRAALVQVAEEINRKRGFMPAAVGGSTP